MSRSIVPSGKRKRPGSGAPPLLDFEQQILDLILSKGSEGIMKRGLKYESKLAEKVINNAIKSLMSKVLIKEVKSIKSQGRKVYMGIECTPSKEVSGGIWYAEGKLDTELIKVLKRVCYSYLQKRKVATLEEIHKAVGESGVMKIDVAMPQVAELLTAMVLDDEIIEVKSTGLGDYYGLPVGEMCYRLASAGSGAGKTAIMGAFASIPCGMCPRIAVCTPGGIISPTTCVYYNKWLDVKVKSNR